MELHLTIKCCLKKDESIINEDANGYNHTELADAVKQQHQQPQGPVIQWDRFLPLRSLKVLLVEGDDSTRHVVSALLRNCSYEVTAVTNGLEAWKVLSDINKQIDLVLTEVVMPHLSGIGLLSKIMNLVPRKNIPVIMMSSDDSMGIVFNCLSKGAVDFLVKPVRKNELKNLWQHVWRKCHSSSGSESESGVGAHKPAKARTIEVSDDDSDEGEYKSIVDPMAKVESDDGSGTQSSWSKRAVEVKSTKYSPDQLAVGLGNTCAQVTHAIPDAVSTEHAAEGDNLDVIEMGKDLEIGAPRNSEKIIESKLKRTSEPRTTLPNNFMAGKTNEALCSPALELSLKRPLDLEDTDTSTTRKRNVIKQSDLSAFSRYNNTGSNASKAPTTNASSCSPLAVTISSKTANHASTQSNSNGAPKQRSNGSSTLNNYMGSRTNNALDGKPNPPGLCEGDKAAAQFNIHHHHHCHHAHKMQQKQQQQAANQDDGSSRTMVSNGLSAPAETHYGSASGSNGENGNSGEKGKIVNLSGSGVELDRFAQREAALNKFRQKRKERCYAKKVRYESRKKLADERPRVRGQFVRQGADL